MAVERKGFRLTDLKLDYVPGDGEQHGDIDVSNLVFIAEGPSQLVPLTRLRSNHWIAKDNAAVSLSEETENVIAVLQGKELDDVANAILSQNELLEQAPARDQGGQGFSQKVEMEDFSLYTETGRWFLSWRNEVVDMGPSPTPVQPGQNFEEEHETQGFLDIAEVSFASLALYGSEKHTGLDEEAWYLTDVTVVYNPEDDSGSASVRIAKVVLFSGENTWALQLVASSANRWEVEGNMNVAIQKHAESLTVSLQDENSEDVALGFKLLTEHDSGDGTKTSKLDGSPHDRKSGVEMASLAGSGGRWMVEYKIELLDAKTRRDKDLVSRWKKLEALFPWEIAADSPELEQSSGAAEAFLARDADAYGSDILLRQAYAVLQQIKCKNADDIAAIEVAIEMQTLLVVDPRVQQSRQMHAIVISHLGAMHHERFKKTMHPEHLDQAISLLQAAIEDITPQTDIHAECLRRLAQGYHTRYQSTSNLDDSVSAITVLSESCELTLQESNLTPLLSWLYEYVGRGDRTAKPLAKAIDHLRRVVESFTGGPTHPLFKYVASLSLLIGPLLKGRCGETEGLEELNNAISHYRIHLSFLQHFPEIPGYSQVLYEYSSLLKDRFLKSEDIADLDEAILIATEALASAPSDNTSIGLLASLYFQRYTQIQVNSDLDESILLQRRFFDSMASDDPSYDDTLDDLVKYLCTRSIASNMENDTEEALTIASNALALNYGAADQQFLYERFQAFVLHQKFLLTRNIDHLSSATKILLQSRCNTSSSTQLKSKVGNLLCDLADSYSDLHGTSHDAELLHKAVACSQKYLMISNTPDAYRQLGKSLHDRFKTSTSNDGLEVAIEALSARLRMLEEHGNEPHPALLLDLGNFIGQAALLNVDLVRYSQAKGLLQRAVLDSEGRKDLHSKALVDLIKHTSCEWFLNAESAGRASYSEFEEDLARNMDRGTILKLRSNLETAEELLLRVPIDAPDYPKGHEIVLSMRIVLAHIDGDSQSMGKVIQHIQKGRQKDPTYGHGLLMIAYQVSRDPLYRDLAIAGYRAAALDTSRETLKRFESTRVWIQIYRVDGGVQPKCLEAYEVAIGLLATVVGLGQRISDRHSQVTDTGEIANWTLQRWAARLPLEAAAKAADSR